MKLLPIEDAIYQSKLSKEELLTLLAENIEPESYKPWASYDEDTKGYKGKIENNYFEVKRISRNRNSFRPVIKGEITPALSGSLIQIKMQMHPFVIVFLCIWFSMVIISCIGVLVTLADNIDFNPGIFIPFGMLIFGYAMLMGAFKYETKKSKAFFQSLFEAHTVTP